MLALLLQLRGRILAGVAGLLPALLQLLGLLLQGQQAGLALFGGVDALAQAGQLLLQPGGALLGWLDEQVGMGGEAGVQLLEVGLQLRLFVAELLQLLAKRLVVGGQFGALFLESLDLLLRALRLVLVLAGEGLQQGIRLVPGVFRAAAHRAGLAVAQLRAQRLDAGAAGQALAFEQGEGDLQRLIGRVQFVAHLRAAGQALLAAGLQVGEAGLQVVLARAQFLAALPQLALFLAVAQLRAPVADLALQLGQLFAAAAAAELLLQRVQGLAGVVQLGLRLGGSLLQRRQFATALVQTVGQLYRLLQARTMAVPGGAQRLQRGAAFELGGQFGLLVGQHGLPFLQLRQRRLAGSAVGAGLLLGLLRLGQVLLQLGQTFLFLVRLGQ
ncbi:hypothetical protein D3C78_738590 [compost metagenome]